MRRNTPRNQAIIAYHEANPDMTLDEIGQVFRTDGKGLTKQRIWAILKYRACSTCYHSRDFEATCACREKVDMVRHNCPDWHPRKDS